MQVYQTPQKLKLENLHRENGAQIPPLFELPSNSICVNLVPLAINVKQVKS